MARVDPRSLLGQLPKTKKLFDKDACCLLGILDECDKPSIKSHSIAATNLRLLQESHHLTRISSKLSSGLVEFEKLSVKKSSTFPGFCTEHDNLLFAEIDSQSLELTERNISLFLIREFMHEFYKKLLGSASTDSYYFPDMESRDAEIQRKMNIDGFNLGARDLIIQAKRTYNQLKQDKYTLDSIVVEFEKVLPFSFLGPINFEIKPSYGNKNPYEESVFESCISGLIPTSTGSKFFLAFPKSQKKYVSILLKRLGNSKSLLAERLLQYSLESFENMYFRPSWVNHLEEVQKKQLLDIFKMDYTGSWLLESTYELSFLNMEHVKFRVGSSFLQGKQWKSKLA